MRFQSFSSSFRFFALVLGDGAVFLATLFIALVIRQGFVVDPDVLNAHFFPFLILLAVFLFILLFADFYHPRERGITIRFLWKLGLAILLFEIIAVLFFYLFPLFGITPKTLLLLHALLLGIGFFSWRVLINRLVMGDPIRCAVLGFHPQMKELEEELQKRHKTRYVLPFWQLSEESPFSISFFIEHRIELVIVAHEKLMEQFALFFLRELLPNGIAVLPFDEFFEESAQKIPLKTLEPSFFLKHLDPHRKSWYRRCKRALDIMGVIFILVPLGILSLGIALLLLVEGKTRAIFYRQKRVGKNGKLFTMLKFATMIPEAEKAGPQWSGPHDHRITRVGKILRKLHLDEIPQLLNILNREMSFVGPRPERPEFVEILQKTIPFYEERFLVLPGLTGWAQLNYPYGFSIEGAVQKLQYDFFYLKNQSFLLDCEILLRSFRLMMTPPKP